VTNRIVISESQYGRLFLGEQSDEKIHPVKIMERPEECDKQGLCFGPLDPGRSGCVACTPALEKKMVKIMKGVEDEKKKKADLIRRSPKKVSNNDGLWSTKSGNYEDTWGAYSGNFLVDRYPVKNKTYGEPLNLKHFCGSYNKSCENCQPIVDGFGMRGWNDTYGKWTGMYGYENQEVKKVVKEIWDLGKKNFNNDKNGNGIIYYGINQYIKNMWDKWERGGYFYMKKAPELEGGGLVKTPMPDYYKTYLKNQEKGLRKLQKAVGQIKNTTRMAWCGVGQYSRNITPISEGLESLVGYLKSFDTQDWIDVAATVAFIIGAVATGGGALLVAGFALELVNLGISVYDVVSSGGKNKKLDVGIRFLCLFGGPLIGKMISKGFKTVKSGVVKLWGIAMEIMGLGVKNINKVIGKYSLTKAEAKVVQEYIEYMKKHSDEIASASKNIDELIKKAKGGDKLAQKELDILLQNGKKYIKATNARAAADEVLTTVTRGSERYTLKRYWADIIDFPSSVAGLSIFGVVFLGSHYIAFHSFMEEQNITKVQQEQIGDFLLQKDSIKNKISVFDKYKIKDGEPLDTTLLNASKQMPTDEWEGHMEELQKLVDEETNKFQDSYTGVANKLDELSNVDSLSSLYNNLCYDDPMYDNDNMLDDIDITVKNSDKRIKKIKDYIESKEWKKSGEGTKYKDKIIVMFGNYKGIYENKNGEWGNIINDCKKSGKILEEFCLSKGKSKNDVGDFCLSIEYGDMSLETFNEMMIINLGNDQELNDLFDL
jgi:hypothetical protein